MVQKQAIIAFINLSPSIYLFIFVMFLLQIDIVRNKLNKI
jgi:hypothetical protein